MYAGYTPISPRHSRFRGNPGASVDTILPRRRPIDSHESGGAPAIPTHAANARSPNHISKNEDSRLTPPMLTSAVSSSTKWRGYCKYTGTTSPSGITSRHFLTLQKSWLMRHQRPGQIQPLPGEESLWQGYHRGPRALAGKAVAPFSQRGDGQSQGLVI